MWYCLDLPPGSPLSFTFCEVGVYSSVCYTHVYMYIGVKQLFLFLISFSLLGLCVLIFWRHKDTQFVHKDTQFVSHGWHNTILKLHQNNSNNITTNESMIANFSEYKLVTLPTEVLYPCDNITSNGRYNYAIEWIHWEQLTMAMTSLVSLAWFTSEWNTRIVEPFTRNSYFYGLNMRGQHPFSLLFDIDEFNNLLCKSKIPPLVSFNEFLLKGSRDIIMVHLFYGESDNGFNSWKFSRTDIASLFNKEENIIDCGNFTYIKKIGNLFLNKVSRLSVNKNSFSIIKYCCIDALQPTNRKDVAKLCGLLKQEEFTLVFSDWRGVSDTANFRLYSPEIASFKLPIPAKNVLPYSQSIKKNAAAFFDTIGKGKDILAFHIRSEKLGIKNVIIPNYFDNCIKEMLKLRDNILSKQRNMTTVFITDIGIFGSRSCQKQTCLGKHLMAAAFKKYNFRATNYNPYKFHGTVDSGFVAAVEQEMLSMAHTLVLIGGGSFQSQVRVRFINNHLSNESKIYQLCH